VLLKALLQYEQDGDATHPPALMPQPPRDLRCQQPTPMPPPPVAKQQPQQTEQRKDDPAARPPASQPKPQAGVQQRGAVEVWEKLL
jgi:hypothetical protein